MGAKMCNIGVIGAGGIANNIHLPVLASLTGANIVSICDCISDRSFDTARKFKIPTAYQSYFEMLEKEQLDAVFVLVQPDAAFRIVTDCLKHGLHVFMEKPMGITLFQARSIAQLARTVNRTVHVGFNRRYIPLVTETLRRIHEITNINLIRGCFYKNSSASFYDGCASAFECDVIHVIDLVRYIAAGAAVHSSTLQVCSSDDNIPDLWLSTILFDNGISGSIQADYRTGSRVHQFEIHGSEASAYIDLGFGGATCSAQILCNQGKSSFSISSVGIEQPQWVQLDGMKIAQSSLYERYYGYYDEDLIFLSEISRNPGSTDVSRLDEDLKTMQLLDQLQNSTIPMTVKRNTSPVGSDS